MQEIRTSQGSKSKVRIYFDNSATSIRSTEFVNSYLESFSKSRTYRDEVKLLQDLSLKLSEIFKTEPYTFSFVPNATYGLNEIAYFLSLKDPNTQVYVSDSEHASNHIPWFKFFKKKPKIFDLNDFCFSSEKGSGIVSFSALSNLEGIEVDLDAIFLRNNFENKILILDATQYVAYKNLDISKFPFDYVVFSAHKIFGPNGIGVIYARNGYGLGINAQNYIFKNRSYILDYAGIEAWVKNIENDFFSKKDQFMSDLNNYFLSNFPKNKFIKVLNKQTKTCIFLLEVISKDISAHDYSFYLSKNGVVVRSGLSCSLLSSEKFNSSKIMRISLSHLNTKKEIDYFFDLIKKFEIFECF